MRQFSDLPKPEYKNTLNHAEASNSDIISVMDANFPKAVEQTKTFAKRFHSSTVSRTAYNVWKFLRNHITYKKDSEAGQLVRLPSRFIADGTGDCKSYSLTAASILANLGLPVAFRYASYSGSTIPSHVYVVTKDENGKTIIVDGVWNSFNSEKRPTYKFDKIMKVYTLSGLDDSEDIDGIGRRKKGRFAHNVKKFAMAPMRQAFLSLVMVNLFGLARKLARTMNRDPKAIDDKWYKLGGKYSTLKKFVKIGMKFVPKKRRIKVNGINGIGSPAVVAAIAAAVPIVVALAPLLKKKGETPEPGETPLPTEVNADGTPKEQTTMEKVMDVAKGAADKLGLTNTAVDPTDSEHAEKFDKETGKNDEPKTGLSINPIYLAVGAGALFLLTRKK